MESAGGGENDVVGLGARLCASDERDVAVNVPGGLGQPKACALAADGLDAQSLRADALLAADQWRRATTTDAVVLPARSTEAAEDPSQRTRLRRRPPAGRADRDRRKYRNQQTAEA